MKRVLLSFSLLMLLAMVGCTKHIQVQDNVYDALGGQVLQVSNDFEYLGHFDPDMVTTTGTDRAKVNNGVTTRADVFVKAEDKVIKEIVVIQRLMLMKSRSHWSAPKGTPIDYHGRTYKEVFFKASRYPSEIINSYMRFFKDKGYSIKSRDMFVCAFKRGVGRQLVTEIYYAMDPSGIPAFQSGSVKEQRYAFLRGQLFDSVTVID